MCVCVCRYSFKLLFDQASLGPLDSPEELQATLDEYEHHWYIGTATDHGWQESVRQEKPFLFSLGHDLAMVTPLQPQSDLRTDLMMCVENS